MLLSSILLSFFLSLMPALSVMLQDSSTITSFVYDPAIGPLLRVVLNVLADNSPSGGPTDPTDAGPEGLA